MPRKDLHKFFLSIVVPSILAIALFILTILTVVLPSFEKNIMEEKKEMISELTNTAWSLIVEYEQEHQNGKISLEEAQRKAALRISKIRYGGEHKDYFWIIDEYPRMIMHPYRDELNNNDLHAYLDPNGKKLFVEATKVVAAEGEGFIDYMWQWKDDSTRIVPKLSFVKGYEPWGWIVGTGIYLEDVKQEIKVLKRRLLRISLFIALIIIVIILYVIRQSLNIENKRKRAENSLRLSQQKYKSLVEASTEGTLMLLNRKIIFSNLKFNRLIGYEAHEILELSFEDIYDADWKHVIGLFSDPKKSISLETHIKCKDNAKKEVIISISKIRYSNNDGYIIINKEVTQSRQLQQETENLSQELQSSLMLMNQPIFCFINSLLKCPIDTSIRDAAKLMTRKKRDVLFVHKDNDIIGVLNNSDLKKRVLAQELDSGNSVMEIMTSPVIAISENALLYEAILMLKDKQISHIAVKNEKGELEGVIGYEDISKMQQNSLSYLIKDIEMAEDIDQLTKIHTRVPVLVNALLQSGDKTRNITRIITSVTDKITQRVLDLTIEELGCPPCNFTFMVFGSEGRMEQTLSTDQDNAIVFDDLEGNELESAYSYFRKMGEIVCNNLNKIGYKLCDGNNMAKNPKWTQPYSVWKDYFSSWINTSDPQSILDACIFFDFRNVYGEKQFAEKLRTHINETVDGKSVFFYHLAQSIIKFKPPVSLFGNIVGNNQSSNELNLDIKKILLPVVGFIRLYALHCKLTETNSIERIRQVFYKQVIQKSMYEELVLSYNYLMQIRFRFQAKMILQNETPNNIIDVNSLTHIEVATLKKIFGEISNLQTKLNFDFKGGM